MEASITFEFEGQPVSLRVYGGRRLVVDEGIFSDRGCNPLKQRLLEYIAAKLATPGPNELCATRKYCPESGIERDEVGKIKRIWPSGTHIPRTRLGNDDVAGFLDSLELNWWSPAESSGTAGSTT